MAGAFFAELGLPQPDHSLGIGGGTAAEQIGRMLPAIEPILAGERPDAVLVYGDTNSTLAGALAAATRRHPGRPRRGRACGASTGGCPRRRTGSSPTTSRAGSSPRRRPPSRTSPPRAIADGVVLVGDVMQDLAARVVGRGPRRRRVARRRSRAGSGSSSRPAATCSRRSTGPRTGRPTAIARVAGAARRPSARPDRPVVLALHPGRGRRSTRPASQLGRRRPGRRAAGLPRPRSRSSSTRPPS